MAFLAVVGGNDHMGGEGCFVTVGIVGVFIPLFLLQRTDLLSRVEWDSVCSFARGEKISHVE